MERDGRASETSSKPAETPARADETRARAYELFLERTENGSDGSEFLDWVAAEAEVLARRRAKAAPGGGASPAAAS